MICQIGIFNYSDTINSLLLYEDLFFKKYESFEAALNDIKINSNLLVNLKLTIIPIIEISEDGEIS